MTIRRTRISHIKDHDVLDELARVLLFQADQLAATASQSIAESFIGFAHGEDGRPFSDHPRSRVDPRRFPIFRVFSDAVAFVTRPHPDHVMGEEVHRLRTFMFHSPRSGPHSAVSRKQQRFMRPWGLCRTIADAAVARWKLEVDRCGNFSVRELALLADVSDDAAVRSIDRGRKEHDADAYVSTSTLLAIDEAVSWLSKQPDFVSSWKVSKDDPHVRSRLASVASTEDLHNFVQLHRSLYAPILPTAARTMSPELAAWENGGFVFEPRRAAAFAQSLGLDVPLFVGKVVEVSMRQGNTH